MQKTEERRYGVARRPWWSSTSRTNDSWKAATYRFICLNEASVVPPSTAYVDVNDDLMNMTLCSSGLAQELRSQLQGGKGVLFWVSLGLRAAWESPQTANDINECGVNEASLQQAQRFISI